MTKQDEQNFWQNQNIRIFLATPLMNTNTDHPCVFILEALVKQHSGSGLLLDVTKSYNEHQSPIDMKHNNIFVPFSKIDHIVFS